MRGWWVLVALVGCGRVNFDPLGGGDAAPECIAGYTMIGEGCYRFVINVDEVPWANAETQCEADGPGAHLVIPDTVGEIALLTPRFGAAQDAWMGGSDLVTEGTHLEVTGGPALLAWASGEPTGAGQDCMQIRAIDSLLADRTCLDNNDYVCEYDGNAVDPSAF